MIVITKDGAQYAVDMKRRVIQGAPKSPGSHEFHDDLPFHKVTRLYAGSKSAKFYDIFDVGVFDTGEIERIEGDVPSESVSGDSGNVIVRTQNSAYEIDQEQKLIRRLAGTNKSVIDQPDGEWIAYSLIEFCEVGRYAMVHYADDPNDYFVTSLIREITGHFVHAPAA